jgi:hypothetical protein
MGRKDRQPHRHLCADCLDNVGSLMSHNLISLHGLLQVYKTNKQSPWPKSASELYRPSGRRLSATSVPTFADRGVSRSQRGGSLTVKYTISLIHFLYLQDGSTNVTERERERELK